MFGKLPAAAKVTLIPHVKTTYVLHMNVWTTLALMDYDYEAEIPSSLVSEPKHRDSRSKTRLGLGIGLEISRTLEPESESESSFLVFWNRNRYPNWNLRSEVPESEPELYFR